MSEISELVALSRDHERMEAYELVCWPREGRADEVVEGAPAWWVDRETGALVAVSQNDLEWHEIALVTKYMRLVPWPEVWEHVGKRRGCEAAP